MAERQAVILHDIHYVNTEHGTKVIYDYYAPKELKKYIKGNEPLFVEFPGDIGLVSRRVLAVPFVGIMLTVTMLLNMEIKVPALDRSFYNSLKEIEEVYKKMYPSVEINILVKAEEIVRCDYEPTDNISLFFTAGVDATSALVELIAKKPLLINIFGGDLRLTDNDSHVELEGYLDDFTTNRNLKYDFIKTNAREMFDENALGDLCLQMLGRKFNHGWWASIAHILSMTTTIAPWMWIKRIKKHYIGSSYDVETKVFDSNNEEMIKAIRYSSCSFSMVDGMIGRNAKVKKIITYQTSTDLPIELKVCWNRTAGKNCSSCEKCYRTIMNIIANHGNPNDYGFIVDDMVIGRIEEFLLENTVSSAFWKPIQKSFQEEAEYWEKIESMKWILNMRLNSPKVYLKKIMKFIK